MALTVSIANAIRFRPLGGEVFMFDNKRNNRLLNEVVTPVYNPESVTIQAQSDSGDAVTCRAWYNNAWTDIVASSVTTVLPYDYTEFILDLSLFTGDVFFQIISGTETWQSELITVEQVDNEYLMLEWFNHENAFTMNYQTGIVPKIHVRGSMDMTTHGGEATVYENQGTPTNLKEIVQRIMVFEAYVSDYMAELITVAMAHDRFFVNEIEYVKSKKPSLEKQGNSNIYKLSAELTQKTVLGLNTHDTGFNVDMATNTTDVMVIEKLNQSANVTADLPAGYLLHAITVSLKAGATATIKTGTIADTDDVMALVDLAVASPIITTSIHADIANASTLFFTLTGAAGFSIDIYIQLIKNRS